MEQNLIQQVIQQNMSLVQGKGVLNQLCYMILDLLVDREQSMLKWYLLMV